MTSRGNVSNAACGLADHSVPPLTRGGFRGGSRGFSLLEVVIAVLLVGLTLTASLKSLNAVLRTHNIKNDQKQGMLLAQDLMDEVLQSPYEDPQAPTGNIGLETGENGATRAQFDDVDDYDGWSATPPQKKDGTALTNYTGWGRRVVVDFADRITHGVLLDDKGLKLITVQVTSPDGETTVLTALRSRWGAQERKPALNTTFVTGAETELQIGTDTDDRIRSGSVYVNQVDAN